MQIILIYKNYITGPNIQDYYGDVLDLVLQMWQWSNRNDSCVSFSLVIVWMCVSGCDFDSIYVTLWCVLYFSHCLCVHSLLLIQQWQECYHVSNPCVKLCSCNIYIYSFSIHWNVYYLVSCSSSCRYCKTPSNVLLVDIVSCTELYLPTTVVSLIHLDHF